MNRRFVIGKVLASLATLAFVVVFNFFLFRVVEGDPVANLFRGRNLTQEQQDELRHEFGLDGSQLEQFGRYLDADGAAEPGPLVHRRTSPSRTRSCERAWPTIALVGISTLLSTVFGVLIGIVAGWKRGIEDRLRLDHVHDGDVLDAGLLARDAPADDVRRPARLARRSAGSATRTRRRGRAGARPGDSTCSCPRSRSRSPTSASTRSSCARRCSRRCGRTTSSSRARKASATSLVRNRHAVPNALLPVVTLIAINFGFVLSGAIAVETIFSWPGLGLATFDALVRPRPADAAGALPRLQRGGDLHEPRRRPSLRACLDPRVRTA